jgi:2-polyprenyl-6-methoxyphenol hydroxylase-like FAD-dependent oxidoreductase
MTERSSSARTSVQTTSAAVIGAGPTGLLAALALAHFGVPTVLVAPLPENMPGVQIVIAPPP